MDLILLIPIIASFIISLMVLPSWIKRAKKIGLVWDDMNKCGMRKIAGGGGLIVIGSFILSVLIYVALRNFYFNLGNMELIEIFALIISILILTGIGLIDDLLGWKLGGLSKKLRMFLCIFAAIPLIVIGAGHSYVGLPFIGRFDLHLWYLLLIVPLGIIGASTTFNFLAGFNGLEAGQGILILSGLSIVAYFTGSPWLSLVGLCMVAALLAFLFFNKYPAKIFPGDALTYPVGGLIAIMAILGNFEKIALFFFIPYFIEIVLKLRGRLRKQSFGKPNKDGSIDLAYKKIYGLEHLAIKILKKTKGKAYEKDVTGLIWIFQMFIILFGFIIFRSSIF